MPSFILQLPTELNVRVPVFWGALKGLPRQAAQPGFFSSKPRYHFQRRIAAQGVEAPWPSAPSLRSRLWNHKTLGTTSPPEV